MNTEQENNYSVAWFSLSECIARGEREKALGVFRLLSHSLTDKALVYQLKGDIHLSFGDERAALQEYKKAAQLYIDHNRLQPACALYEHITYKQPESLEDSFLLLLLYYQLGITHLIEKELNRISGQLCKKESFELLSQVIKQAKDASYTITLYSDIINILHTASDKSYTRKCIMAMLDELIDSMHATQLHYFLQTLETIDEELYQYASEYITPQQN